MSLTETVQPSPLGSNPGEVVGAGGCVALALAKIGVFSSYDEAVKKLDKERELYISKVRADQNCEAFLGTPGLTWHREIIKRAVVKAGYDYKIVDNSSLCGAAKCMFLVDGIVNWRFLCNDKWVQPFDLTDEDDRPWKERKSWQHVIGILDGKIMRNYHQSLSLIPI